MAVPVALPLAEADEPDAVAEADEEPELEVPVAVALAEPLLAVDEAVPVESAPVLDAVDEPEEAVADADAEEEEDEPSVMLNWFYRSGSISAHDSFHKT